MDACKLEFLPDDCFDMIIDKGLFDAQLCTVDNLTNVRLAPTSPRPPRTAPREESLCAACLPQVSRMVKEMHRVLKPGGVYVVISHGVPTSRLGYLSGSWLEWSVEHQPIREGAPPFP